MLPFIYWHNAEGAGASAGAGAAGLGTHYLTTELLAGATVLEPPNTVEDSVVDSGGGVANGDQGSGGGAAPAKGMKGGVLQPGKSGGGGGAKSGGGGGRQFLMGLSKRTKSQPHLEFFYFKYKYGTCALRVLE